MQRWGRLSSRPRVGRSNAKPSSPPLRASHSPTSNLEPRFAHRPPVHRHALPDAEGKGGQVEKLAAGFLSVGLSPGDGLLLWGGNHGFLLVAAFAAARAGLVFTTLHPSAPPDTLVHLIKWVTRSIGPLLGVINTKSLSWKSERSSPFRRRKRVLPIKH